MKLKMKILGATILIALLTEPGFAPAARAQFKKEQSQDYVTVLSEANINDFLQKVSAISTGQRPDMMDEDVIDYFANHVAERATFKSQMRFEIPNYPAHDTEMELDKEEYIASVVKSRYMIEDYRADIEIRNLTINGSGKQASFVSIITEKGKMPFPKDKDNPDDVELVPINGRSECAQKLIVSFNNFIQLAQADCKTLISFDPFGDKPLVPQ